MQQPEVPVLPVQSSAFITCALTGAGDSTGVSDKVPVTPEQIAASALEAAAAGAAVVHIHVRDPETGKGARRPELFREVVERIRAAQVDVVLNLTTGMGGDLVLGGAETPLPPSDGGTDMAGATERLQHVAELLPEICTLDAGTMNFAAGGDYIMVNTPQMVRAMAKGIKELGVKPEVEIFDTGDLVLLNELVREGLVDDPAMVQLCMGIPYGAPNDLLTLQSMISNLPPGSVYSMFSIGRYQLPYAALAPLVGANVRVGLEDNLYLSKGRLATNGELVGRAVTLLEAMNIRVMTPAEVRDKLGLVKHG
jgi:3-dehydrocarnitine:acetyl-CoA trimethylamine transferase